MKMTQRTPGILTVLLAVLASLCVAPSAAAQLGGNVWKDEEHGLSAKIPEKWVALTSDALQRAQNQQKSSSHVVLGGFSRTNGRWTFPNFVVIENQVDLADLPFSLVRQTFENSVDLSEVVGLKSGPSLQELYDKLPVEKTVFDQGAKRYYIKSFINTEKTSDNRTGKLVQINIGVLGKTGSYEVILLTADEGFPLAVDDCEKFVSSFRISPDKAWSEPDPSTAKSQKKKGKSKSNPNAPIIIGGVVAGVILLVIIIVVIQASRR